MMIHIQPIPAPEARFPRLSEPAQQIPALERVRGHARLSFAHADGETRLVELYQSGSARIRLPRTAAGAPKEAVLINTAGGLTGGDHIALSLAAGPGAHAVVATQAAERIYRRRNGSAAVEMDIAVESGARLDWLPQETILFDNSALSRRLSADVAADATLLAVEAIVLGRVAMGETARNIALADSWRVRRAGTLVFADGLRLDGDASAVMAGSATGRGAAAVATLLYVAPDAEARIAEVRQALDACRGEAGASAWNGMLVARLIAPSGQALRADLIRLVEALRGVPMPRIWNS